MKASEICVPLKSLAIESEPSGAVGESGVDSTAPAEGDSGEASVRFTVNRIEGDKAYITLTAVNGEPIQAEEKPAEDEETPEMMREMGEKFDGGGSEY